MKKKLAKIYSISAFYSLKGIWARQIGVNVLNQERSGQSVILWSGKP